MVALFDVMEISQRLTAKGAPRIRQRCDAVTTTVTFCVAGVALRDVGLRGRDT